VHAALQSSLPESAAALKVASGGDD
jgi:hypothetical protein